jgi:hypothetical protein
MADRERELAEEDGPPAATTPDGDPDGDPWLFAAKEQGADSQEEAGGGSPSQHSSSWNAGAA